LIKYSYANTTGSGSPNFETLNGYYPAGDGYSESRVPRGGGANDGYWVSSFRFSYVISNTKKDEALSRIYQIHEKPAKKVEKAIPDEFLKFTDRYDLTHLIHLSTETSEIPTDFYKDGILIDSDRADARNKSGRKNIDFDNIYYVPFSDMQKAELIAPVIVGDETQGKLNRAGAVYSTDFDRIVITMFEDVSKAKNQDYQSLYTADAVGENRFTNAKKMGFNNVNYSLAQPSISADGATLFMVSDVPGGYGGTDIYVSYFHRGQWALPQNLGPSINTEKDEAYPFIHKDGTLYFSSDGHDGIGGLDVFEATKVGTDYLVFNLGAPINSPYNDLGFIINDVKRTGYFASNRVGGYGFNDIYEVNVIALSKDMLLTGDGNLQDIKEIKVKVNVVDEFTNLPITGAYIKFINSITNELDVLKSNKQDSNTFTASTAYNYQVGITASGYERMKEIDVQDLTKIGDVNEIEMTIKMTTNKVILSVGDFVKYEGEILEDVPVKLINLRNGN
jgi:hypothetical protein